KYVVYVPNADHDLGKDWRRIMGGLRALHRHAHHHETLPPLRWQYTQDPATHQVSLEVTPGLEGAQLRLWTAQSPTRDFRKARWTSQPLELDPAGQRAVAALSPSASA